MDPVHCRAFLATPVVPPKRESLEVRPGNKSRRYYQCRQTLATNLPSCGFVCPSLSSRWGDLSSPNERNSTPASPIPRRSILVDRSYCSDLAAPCPVLTPDPARGVSLRRRIGGSAVRLSIVVYRARGGTVQCRDGIFLDDSQFYSG